MERFAKTAVVIAGLAAAGAVLAWSIDTAAQNLPVRQSFDILTGPVSGTYFPMGELIARVVSHPPGLARCEKKGVCGPPGVIVSAKSSDGAVANVLAVNSGAAESGLAQANVVADALAGRGAFQRYGRQTHIRAIADLFPESLQLVVAARGPVKTVADLRGKRVSIGSRQSGTEVIAAQLMRAYSLRRVRLRREGYEDSADLLRAGKIDAFFFLGVAPSPLIAGLVDSGQARLVPIDGKGRARLIAQIKGLSADAIPAAAYRGAGRVESVSVRTLWITQDTAPVADVYALVRALYDPANRDMLAQGPPPAQQIRLAAPVNTLSIPLHPGAARFYRNVGRLPSMPAKPSRK